MEYMESKFRKNMRRNGGVIHINGEGMPNIYRLKCHAIKNAKESALLFIYFNLILLWY